MGVLLLLLLRRAQAGAALHTVKVPPMPLHNPFGVMDVPAPDDAAVNEFAVTVNLAGADDDDNAAPWAAVIGTHEGLEGDWRGRWNGGADPTIPGDAPDKWKEGPAQARLANGRVYLLFKWEAGARRGLIDARRDGPARLVGKYINLTNPAITRPWTGFIVSNRRIDGRWTSGRLDFRR
jgi:hypothetical protein